jgi:UDP-N-acetylmuramoylalanine-D-glutamate ligase
VIKPINILLAPAAASQDQFKDFEHRGNLFIELYHKLSKASLNEVINLL